MHSNTVSIYSREVGYWGFVWPPSWRADRSVQGKPPLCKLCWTNAIEDLNHALVDCAANNQLGRKIFDCITPVEINVHQQALLLQMEITPSNELPVVWFLAVAWMNIWSTRKSTRRLEYYKVRADLEAKVSLLRETRFSISAARVGEFINRL